MNSFEGPAKFPTGVERKKLLAENAKNIEEFKKVGVEKIKSGEHYSWVDSPLDSGYGNFSLSLFMVMPEVGELSSYIEKTLEKKKGEAIGVEFGGPAVKLFEGFSPGFFKKSVGVTLVNHLEEEKKPETIDEVQDSNHTILESDILSDETYSKLGKILEGKKVDLIIERLGRGMEFMPPEPYLLFNTVSKWYDLLDEGGMMFVQTPVSFNTLLGEWGAMMKKEYSNVLEIQYDNRGMKDSRNPASVFRLRKLAGAPAKLPFLDARTVYNAPKNEYPVKGDDPRTWQ